MIRRFVFHTAVDWAGKPPWRDIPKPKLAFPLSSPIRSWREKSLERLSSHSPPGSRSPGEDFFVCTNMRDNSGVALGLGDGVGGWTEQGIDSSMFSQALMYYAHRHFENGWAGEPEIDPIAESNGTPEGITMTPSMALRLAHRDVLADSSVEAGSSTACFLTLNAASGALRTANLGDSGFCIVRSSSIFYNSVPQTHFFNCPRQLAKFQSAKDKKNSIDDHPSAAEEYSTRLIDGDLIIAYTDGLSDNVFPAEVLQICSLVMNGPESEAAKVQKLAQTLVFYSRRCMSSDQVSPFEREAKKHRQLYGGKLWQGGKVDDVTVVVALVQETP
ncbi:phosphatase 2C-like domain-containing protein [Mycena albidolilacea]|uniref:Protein phosphatase n=1 Tax=Mycena albidolilacea TaxID=1033008 RepID=A0AAD7EP17_9AGAR|nr:phosphatase 2C-like domain-containing protein [Mycena albidolilacea]